MDDIVKEEYYCPRCGSLLKEKLPTNDKYLIVNKEHTLRLFCPCGYYRDEIIKDIYIHD